MGDVRIENGRPRFLVTRANRRVRRGPVTQFFSDTLADQHVRIDRHAQCQHDAGDARHGQRDADQRHHRHQDHQVEEQRDVGDQAEQLVVNRRSQQHQRQAQHDRLEALVDVVLTKAGTDHALLDNVDWRSQRTAFEQHGEIRSLLRTAQTIGLELSAESTLDRGVIDNRLGDFRRAHFLAVNHLGIDHALDIHHGHWLVDVVVGEVTHLLGASRVQRDIHVGRTVACICA